MRSLFFHLLIFFCSANSSWAEDHLGFRWGGPDDDAKLIQLSDPLPNHEYSLNKAAMMDTMHFLQKKGWSKRGSGAGIYYSSDIADSFSDGRSELFIFNISETIPISEGALGTSVHNYYFNHGVRPPIISRYGDTWHVIARVPGPSELKSGERITFHRATALDAPTIFEQFKAEYLSNPKKLNSVLSAFARNTQDKKLILPLETRDFIEAYTQKIREELSNTAGFNDRTNSGPPWNVEFPSSKENLDEVLSNLKIKRCNDLMSGETAP